MARLLCAPARNMARCVYHCMEYLAISFQARYSAVDGENRRGLCTDVSNMFAYMAYVWRIFACLKIWRMRSPPIYLKQKNFPSFIKKTHPTLLAEFSCSEISPERMLMTEIWSPTASWRGDGGGDYGLSLRAAPRVGHLCVDTGQNYAFVILAGKKQRTFRRFLVRDILPLLSGLSPPMPLPPQLCLNIVIGADTQFWESLAWLILEAKCPSKVFLPPWGGRRQ